LERDFHAVEGGEERGRNGGGEKKERGDSGVEGRIGFEQVAASFGRGNLP